MHDRIRRAATVAGGTVGALVLLAAPAAAHYCYMLVPEGSARADSTAWATADDVIDHLPGFLEGECRTAVIAHIRQLEAKGAMFLEPGLLAGGAVSKGKGPAHIGHLVNDLGSIEACAPPPAPAP